MGAESKKLNWKEKINLAVLRITEIILVESVFLMGLFLVLLVIVECVYTDSIAKAAVKEFLLEAALSAAMVLLFSVGIIGFYDYWWREKT